MGYSDVFGGSSVQPADVGFRAVSLSANLVTVWPSFATTGNQCARIMKVTPTVGSLSVSLPDATLTTAGMDVLFDNPSSFSFTVLDFTGGVVATVAAGQVKYVYLSDSSTQAGTWRTTIFGVGSSTLDAASLAGYGLKALSNTLNTAAVVSNIGGSTAVTLADRSKVFVWTGGTGTLTLPSTTGSTSDFAIEVHNQGSGVMTVVTTGGVLIDGSSTIALSINESCFIHMGSTDWYTVGRGRNVQFNFTQLNKTVTGGTVALTLTEASNVVQKYSGVLLSNQIVNQPAVVQVYYVSNNTTGAYTLTFGCVGGGTSVSVTQGQAAILFCDGVNIINANTSLAGGITALVFANGSASSPSAAFGTASTGFYVSGSNEIGVTNNGVAAGKFTSGGYTASAAGAVAIQAVSAGGQADLIADRPAGSSGGHRWRSSGVDRWTLEATNTAESGANAGSNFALDAYSDAGALLGTALTVNRASQVVSFTQPLDGGTFHAATGKATPVDADEMPLVDSATSFSLKKLTWANLKATLLAWLQGTVFPAPGAIGSTTPAAGSFTTLSASGEVSSTSDFRAFSGAYVYLNNAANSASANMQFVGGELITGLNTAPNLLKLSSTGLAVTGALSASGGISSNTLAGGVVGLINLQRSGVNKAIVALDSSDNLSIYNAAGLVQNLTLTDSGNLGLGVVPKAWRNDYTSRALQIGPSLGLYGYSTFSNHITTNGWYDQTTAQWQYINSAAAADYLQASGSHSWLTAPSGTAGTAITFTQAMTLFTSGGLSVGNVIDPGAKGFNLGSAIGNSVGSLVASINFAGYSSVYGAGIKSYNPSTDPGIDYQDLRFYTSAGPSAINVERARIDASGNLLVGTTFLGYVNQNSFNLHVVNGTQYCNHINGTATATSYIGFGYNGGAIGSITQTGTTAVAYNTTSDHRLKTNVRPANAAAFMAIEFVDFEWTDGRHDCGVIADQLQSVYPDLVLGAVDATEVRQIEITPAVPAVTEQVELTPAVDAIAEVVDADGVVTQEAVPAVAATYETVEVTPAIPAVTEDQTFPVYQQVNYMGLIGRMGARVQQLQRTVDSQTSLIAAMEARLIALEAK